MGRLDGQVAWISGATKGIGLSTAEMFVEDGAAVTVLSRHGDEAEKVAADLRAKGGRAIGMGCDVSKEEDVKKSIDATVKEFGKLDTLINNAGIVDVKWLHEYTSEDFDRVMNINVKSIFFAFKHAYEHLIKNEKSYVVNVASISSVVAQLKTPVYTTSKGAIVQLTKSIAVDYAHQGIRCNVVLPGITLTPMLWEHLNTSEDPNAKLKERCTRVPIDRWLDPEEVAKSIRYFACEDSSGIIGASLLVDGGYLAVAEWDANLLK